MVSVCSVEGCERAVKVKGLCSPHYHRSRAHGDPTGGRTYRGDTLHFIENVALGFRGKDCLIWPFARGRKGYGQVRVEGKIAPAHKYICELVRGAPPSEVHQAAHSCGKGHEGCVNPNHLSWKTPSENQMDRVAHGTHKRGERQWMATITEAQAREIINLKGLMTRREISDLVGVKMSTVYDIHSGKSWSWLEAARKREDAA